MAASKKKIGLVSLGCAKNLVDSENLLACFPKDEFEITLRPDEADVIVVNTCGFIDAAKKEAVETILEMGNYPAKLVVTGCLLYKDLDEIRKSLPEVDLFVPLSDYPRFGELVGKLLEEPVKEIDPLKRELSTALPFAYMKISEGCSNYCAFCAIPYIRGPYRSRTMEELVEEGRILYEKGVRELALVSQDPMHYGVDLPGRPKMVDLLKELTAIGFPSIRLLYLYPDEIDDEFLLYVKDNPAVEKYFDIPIQSGSDEVLKKMNRKDTRESMRKLFARIRELYHDRVEEVRAHISGAWYTDEQIARTVQEAYDATGYLLDPHGACAYRALQENLREGEHGVFLETAHPAKFRDTIERIIGREVRIPERLRAFMQGEKQTVPMTKDFADFKHFLLSLPS